jgi:hypothetical protein
MTRQLRIDEAPVEKGMLMYTRNASYRLGVSAGCFSQSCGGAPAFVESFAIRALMVSRDLVYWLLDQWSQPANGLPNPSRDSMGQVAAVADAR